MAAVTDAGKVSVSSSGTPARASSHACVCSDLLGTCRHSVQFKDWCLQALCCSNGPNLIKLEHLPNSIYSKWEKGQSRYQQSGIPKFPDTWELLLHRKLFHMSRMVERIWRGIQLKAVSSIIIDSPVTTK